MGDQEKIMRNFQGLCFWTYNFQGIYIANIVLWNIIKYYLAQDLGFKIQDSRFMIQKEKYENALQKKYSQVG